jgi:hypothetical protein
MIRRFECGKDRKETGAYRSCYTYYSKDKILIEQYDRKHCIAIFIVEIVLIY